MRKKIALTGVFLISISVPAILIKRSTKKKYLERIKKEETCSQKHLEIAKMYDRWITIKQRGRSIADYLMEHGYYSVAIYGMSFVGETLYDELRNTKVSVKYAIDKNASNLFHDEIEIVSPDDRLEKVDLIIVTSNFYFNVIEDELQEKTDIKIVNFEDLLYDI